MKKNDSSIVLSLDAGGTNFVFSAIRNGKEIGKAITKPSNSKNIDKCLTGIVDGFRDIIAQLPSPPAAISFAFPGPADYPNGIIGDLENLPAFRGGVALGPMLEEAFGIPVFINNDGDLFAYGEAIAGLLPEINNLLEKQGNKRRYKNLFGVTLGTGFGAGFVHNGKLYIGDNSAGAEIWVTRSMLNPNSFAEEDISIRAVKRNYISAAGINTDSELSPKDIFNIANGKRKGNQDAALFAFDQLGSQLGDSLANAITLFDCNVVIGGGLSNAYPLFAPAMMKILNGKIKKLNGQEVNRMEVKAYDLESKFGLEEFINGSVETISVRNSNRKAEYDSQKRVGIGLSRLGTSHAVAVGAWAFALNSLKK